MAEGEIDSIELLYVHNLPESVNVTRELQTVASHLRKALGDASSVAVTARELGASVIDHMFSSQESHIEVRDEILCPAVAEFTTAGPAWEASVMSLPGAWLYDLFAKHGEALFSANYRGFLGISRRRRINTGIRQSAESKPKDFWVFNNGITLLTQARIALKDGTRLSGVSIINGAQTTGSIGSVDLTRTDLKDVRVLCRVIQCTDADTINDIVKYNNTQNEITTWDQYSNDAEQNRIAQEFEQLGHKYVRKRGFRPKGDQIGIEEVAQPLLSFHGRFQDANRGKNLIFDRKPLYVNAFEGKKARHILLVHALARAIDERRIELKGKSDRGEIISLEEGQLALLRNLRFKQFLIAVIAKSLETIVGKKVDPEAIAFGPDAAKADRRTLVELAAAWTPVVETVLAFTATKVTAGEISTKISEEGFVSDVAKHVSVLLYAGQSDFSDFAGLLADS